MNQKDIGNLSTETKLKWLSESIYTLKKAKYEDFETDDVQSAIGSLIEASAVHAILDYYEIISGCETASFDSYFDEGYSICKGEESLTAALKKNPTAPVHFLGVSHNGLYYNTKTGIHGDPGVKRFILSCYDDTKNEDLPWQYREMLKGMIFYEGLKLAYDMDMMAGGWASHIYFELQKELEIAREHYGHDEEPEDDECPLDYYSDYLALACAATIALRDELSHTTFGYAYGRPFLMIRNEEPA